jgi:hypothetical protein
MEEHTLCFCSHAYETLLFSSLEWFTVGTKDPLLANYLIRAFFITGFFCHKSVLSLYVGCMLLVLLF